MLRKLLYLVVCLLSPLVLRGTPRIGKYPAYGDGSIDDSASKALKKQVQKELVQLEKLDHPVISGPAERPPIQAITEINLWDTMSGLLPALDQAQEVYENPPLEWIDAGAHYRGLLKNIYPALYILSKSEKSEYRLGAMCRLACPLYRQVQEGLPVCTDAATLYDELLTKPHNYPLSSARLAFRKMKILQKRLELTSTKSTQDEFIKAAYEAADFEDKRLEVFDHLAGACWVLKRFDDADKAFAQILQYRYLRPELQERALLSRVSLKLAGYGSWDASYAGMSNQLLKIAETTSDGERRQSARGLLEDVKAQALEKK